MPPPFGAKRRSDRLGPDLLPTTPLHFDNPLISVCILAGHGVRALDACLTSLEAQSSPPGFELLVGTRQKRLVLPIVKKHFPSASVCETGPRLPGAARNPLVEQARGELLLFLDDDVTAPPRLLEELAELAQLHPEAAVFGGPNETPPGATQFQKVQGAVLSSLAGVGPVSRRYGPRPAGAADERWFTLCNLAIRRRVMYPFDTNLVCAEENALLATLRSNGERMHYDPRLRVFHARRPTLRSFASQMYKYGRGRGELLVRQPRTLRAAYLAPSGLLIYLALLPVLIRLGRFGKVALLPAGLYLGLTGASALRVGQTLKQVSATPLAAALTATIHFCYGTGVLRGLLLPSRARQPPTADWTFATESASEGGTEALRTRSSGRPMSEPL